MNDMEVNSIRIKGVEYQFGNKSHLKILLLGNSYGSDAWSYVPFILKNYGITCEIYMYWRGGISLDDLVTFWEETQFQDTTTAIQASGAYRYLYHIDTRTDTCWAGNDGLLLINEPALPRKSAKELCAMGGWDIITLLQFSGYTVDYRTFEPYVSQIIDLIREVNDESFNLGFQMSWTRPVQITPARPIVNNLPESDNPTANLASHLSNDKTEPFSITFPCSTAVFNCRQNSDLAQIGSSQYHNLWCSDDVHLEEGLPCYIAACAIVQALFDKYWPDKSILGDPTRPTDENVRAWKIPWAQLPKSGNTILPITSVTDNNCYLAQKAAILANKYKFEINSV